MPESRRSRRRRTVSELRAQGRYGPGLRDVLPSFVGVGLLLLGTVLLLNRLSRTFGVTGLVIGLNLLAMATVVTLRVRRAFVRRRGGHYTAEELARLDDRGLAEATARILERDGWQVADLSLRKGRLRLYARDRHGRELDVTFRPVAIDDAATDDEEPPWPATVGETDRPGVDRPGRVIVRLGGFSRSEVLWASRHRDVHLVDGRRLRRWAAGTSLDRLRPRR
ncbi:hypothetical protein GCM10014715_62900 [Streptomyces spiralis]|uniref:Uncharacterized protein n=1 Tax=Streptomyces spiralis TaxID=66376 RepID=A0A919AC60_9ACTN|nr:hypothetical protein GCM10014715_62900 [Streptomyces spiralis]